MTNKPNTPRPARDANASQQAADPPAQLAEAALRTFLDGVSEFGITITDLDGRIVFTNNAEAAMHGCTIDELIGAEARSLAPQELSRPIKHEELGKLTVWTRDTVNLHKDGSRFPVRLTSTLITDSDGHPLGMLASSQDLSERKRIERALAVQEAVFAGSRDAIFLSEEGGKLAMVNPAAATLTGYTVEELLAMRIPDLHEEADLHAFNTFHDRILAGEEVLSEARIKRKDGSKVLSEFSNRRVVLEGQPFVHTTARDVSARERTEIELRRHVQQLDVLNAASVAFGQTLDIEEVGRRIIAALESLLDWQRGSIWLVEEPQRELRLLAHSDMGLDGVALGAELARERTLVLRLGDGITGWVAAHGATVRTGDVANDPRYRVADPSIRSELCVPLTLAGVTIGAINVESRQRDAFSEHDEQVLAVLASHAAISIQNARLFGSLQRELSERGLVETRAHLLAQAIKSVGECIIITDETNRILFVNPAFVETYGFAEDEIVGQPIDVVRVMRPDEPPPDGVRDATLAGGWRGELLNRRKDGTEFPVRLSTSVVHDQDGRPVALIGVASDITARRLADTALRDSEARYRHLFERNLAGVYRSTVAGRLLDCNDAFVQIYGYTSREKALACPAEQLHCSSEARQDFIRLLQVEGFLRSFESAGRRRDGSPISLLENAALVPDEGGMPTIIEGTVIDITEHKRTQEQLEHAQRIEAVGQLAGGVAHDFNNLMQAMLTRTQLMRASSADPERVVAAVEELEDQVRRGAGLTRQLLLFSRRETIKRELLDLNEVVSGATKLLRRLVRENIAFDVDLADEGLVIEADAGQMEQVLMNLVVNAADAMPGGGRVTIRTRRLDPDTALLRVEDTGYGMSEALRQRIFEPFFTTKGTGKGTGLGLSVVYGIVTQHGGRIDVDSKVEHGSGFSVSLATAQPGGSAEPVRSPALLREPPGGAGERVLIVEDEDAAREGLHEILSALGYDVTALGSGEAALALPTEPPFDILLTDLILPGIPGTDLARHLKRRWNRVAVVLMSGYTEDEAFRRSTVESKVHFLQKPFDMAALAVELRAALADR